MSYLNKPEVLKMRSEIFNDVVLSPEFSVFYTSKKKKLLSGVNVTSKFKPKFDPDGKIVAALAEKNSKTVGDIKAEWKAKGKKSRERNELTRKLIESLTYSTSLDLGEPYDEYAYKWAIRTKHQFLNLFNPENLLTNVVIYDLHNEISDQVDLLHVREDGSVDLFNYKTDNSLDMTSKYNSYMDDVLDHVEDCNYNYYSIQLSLCAYMLEKKGIKVNTINILHLDEKADKVVLHEIKDNIDRTKLILVRLRIK